MKVEQLLEQLKTRREELVIAITLIESQLIINGTKKKRESIIKEVKKKLHWTQKPENKTRLKKQLKRANQIKLGIEP